MRTRCLEDIIMAMIVCLWVVTVEPARAQQQVQVTVDAVTSATPESEATDNFSITSHNVTIGGTEIQYTATAGTLVMRHLNGKPKANVFFVSYVNDGPKDKGARPITFFYNGGPGSASIWLHMGVMGPRRVQMASGGFQPAPPYSLVDNEYSLLDVTDVVAIDPVSTGFSRPFEGEDLKQFHGVHQDIKFFSDFIRLYLTRFDRWTSPKYLLGESYGTLRSAGVAADLQARLKIELNGIILVSSVIDFMTLYEVPGNNIYYASFLPTYTVTAWYHKRLPADLQGLNLEEVVAKSRAFAFGEYLLALTKGNRLSREENQAMAEKMARYTGLSSRYILQANLRVNDKRFRKELLRDQRLMVGRLDSRFTGIDADAAGEVQEFDPSDTAAGGAFTAMINDYFRRELNWKTDLSYRSYAFGNPWDYGDFAGRYVNLTESLRYTMARNPFLQVFVANGYYDVATPFGGTEFTFDQLGFESTYQERVSMGYYEAGHMMYIRLDVLQQFKHDVAAFIQASDGSSREPIQ